MASLPDPPSLRHRGPATTDNALPAEDVAVPPHKHPEGLSPLNLADSPVLFHSAGFGVIFVHAVALAGCIAYGLPKWQTWVLAYANFQLATLGVTMGYHRLFSHRSYKAHPLLRLVLVLMGSLALQGSARWWSAMHRLHHRFPESSNDPYRVGRGLWFAHIGWLYEKAKYTKLPLVEVDDLEEDPIVVWQDRHLVPIMVTFGYILPTALGLLWGDPIGAFFYVAFLSHVAVWHVTWFINSLAHYVGEAPFTTEGTAKGHIVALALLTNGEAYHNFHHEFPKDYRNGTQWWDWDPTKWLINLSARIGLATNLTATPDAEIAAARAYVKTYHLSTDAPTDSPASTTPDILNPPDASSLPSMTKTSIASAPGLLIIVDGYVLDVSEYGAAHPGGSKWLERYKGKDATKAFMGGVNFHTRSARRMATRMVVGKVEG